MGHPKPHILTPKLRRQWQLALLLLSDMSAANVVPDLISASGKALGSSVWVAGCRGGGVNVSGFRVQVQGLELRVQGGFGIWGSRP